MPSSILLQALANIEELLKLDRDGAPPLLGAVVLNPKDYVHIELFFTGTNLHRLWTHLTLKERGHPSGMVAVSEGEVRREWYVSYRVPQGYYALTDEPFEFVAGSTAEVSTEVLNQLYDASKEKFG